ncbi:MAG: hypothetical protein EBY26_03855 [Microbacteriaceae bacterium]|nr:hypothetical protein [Microbacteriaceae bacterium]
MVERSLSFLLTAVVFAFFIGNATGAGEPAQAADSYSVNIAKNGVRDQTRSTFNFGTMDVAATKTDNILISNRGDKTLTFVVFARFAYTAGTPAQFMVGDSDSAALDSADWMTFGATKLPMFTVKIDPKKTAVVPVNMTIPKGAFPGKHKGAVVVASNIGTGTVTLAKRVAVFYDVQVPGALKAVATPSWATDTTYYNASIRNLSATKNFAGASDRMDELKALGIEGLILEPIFPIGKSKMLGTIGSVFASSDLSTVNPSLGDEAAFKKLVDTAKKNGIKVILTVPLATAAVDHGWVTEKPNWFVRDAKFALVSDPNTPFLASYDFKQEELRQQLVEDITGLVTKFGIDGFVFTDATKVDQSFVDELCFRLQSIKELMIGTTDDKSAKFFVNSLSFTRNDSMRALFDRLDDGSQKVSDFEKLIKNMNSTYIGVEFPLNHVSSYETMVGLTTETARLGAALPLAVALTFTLPGAPMIFMGQEVKSIKALKPYDADTIVWPKKNPAEYTTYQQLIKLRKQNAALFTGKDSVDGVMLKTTSTSLLAFKRTSGKSTVIVVANLSKKSLTANFDAGSALKTFAFSTDKAFAMKSTANKIQLDPFEYEIYTLNVVK